MDYFIRRLIYFKIRNLIFSLFHSRTKKKIWQRFICSWLCAVESRNLALFNCSLNVRIHSISSNFLDKVIWKQFCGTWTKSMVNNSVHHHKVRFPTMFFFAFPILFAINQYISTFSKKKKKKKKVHF